MRHLAPTGFVALALLPLLHSSSVRAAPASAGSLPRTEAPENAPRVTRDNFVSVSLEQTAMSSRQREGLIGSSVTSKVQGNTVTLDWGSVFAGFGGGSGSFGGGGGGGGFGNFPSPISLPHNQGISNRQLDELIQKINGARLTALAGNYKQPNLADGVQGTLIVTISDKNNRDQQFIIQNFGNTAPKSYFEFTAYFHDLVQMKFPGTSIEVAAPIPPDAKPTNP